MRKLIRRIIAFFRLNSRIICEESRGMGEVDYHDYHDATVPEPWHFTYHICRRCGKTFII